MGEPPDPFLAPERFHLALTMGCGLAWPLLSGWRPAERDAAGSTARTTRRCAFTDNIRWPVLILGMGLTLVAALSVHVVMLQGLHVPFPNNTLVAWPPRYLNMALAMLAMILFNDVATPWMASRSWLSRTVLLFLVFSMLREELVRAVVMDGVTTTAWTFSLPGEPSGDAVEPGRLHRDRAGRPEARVVLAEDRRSDGAGCLVAVRLSGR